MVLEVFGTRDARRTYAETDLCCKAGAELLKAKIEDYWAARGQLVSVELKEAAFVATMRSTRWDVRSNLVGGYPQKLRTQS